MGGSYKCNGCDHEAHEDEFYRYGKVYCGVALCGSCFNKYTVCKLCHEVFYKAFFYHFGDGDDKISICSYCFPKEYKVSKRCDVCDKYDKNIVYRGRSIYNDDVLICEGCFDNKSEPYDD